MYLDVYKINGLDLFCEYSCSHCFLRYIFGDTPSSLSDEHLSNMPLCAPQKAEAMNFHCFVPTLLYYSRIKVCTETVTYLVISSHEDKLLNIPPCSVALSPALPATASQSC